MLSCATVIPHRATLFQGNESRIHAVLVLGDGAHKKGHTYTHHVHVDPCANGATTREIYYSIWLSLAFMLLRLPGAGQSGGFLNARS